MFSLYQSSQNSAVAQIRDKNAPAQFFAGWFDIVLDQDEREYILDCYSNND